MGRLNEVNNFVSDDITPIERHLGHLECPKCKQRFQQKRVTDFVNNKVVEKGYCFNCDVDYPIK